MYFSAIGDKGGGWVFSGNKTFVMAKIISMVLFHEHIIILKKTTTQDVLDLLSQQSADHECLTMPGCILRRTDFLSM